MMRPLFLRDNHLFAHNCVCFGQGVRARAEHHQLEHWQHMQLVITQSGTFLRPLQHETPVEAKPKKHYSCPWKSRTTPRPYMRVRRCGGGGPSHVIMCMIVYQMSACCRSLSPPPFDRTWKAESGYIMAQFRKGLTDVNCTQDRRRQ